MSQHADDITLTLVGSEKSLKCAMKVLKYHGDISGLQLNVDKTKVVWIGSMKNSVTKLCPEDLSWEENSFNLLGVTFSKNLNKISDLNYTKRALTPKGKIVINKTLALPNVNHPVTKPMLYIPMELRPR